MEPFFGRQFSMWHSTKLFSSIFDLDPVTPKIYPQNLHLHKIAYKSASMADRQKMFGPTGGFSGMADSTEPCKMLWGRRLLPWQRNFVKFGLFFTESHINCMPDRPHMFGKISGETTRGADLCCHGNDICARRGV